MHNPPPTLLTRQLSLTPPSLEDFDEVATMWADAAVVRYISGQTRDRQDSWFAHLRNRGFWDLLGYGYWVIRERKTGTFVGEVGFADYMREMQPDLSGNPEAGWALAKSAWGKGYATEAVLAAHGWLDDMLPGRSTCIIDPDHAVSIHIALKVGYIEVGPADYRGSPVIVFERFSPQSGSV